MGVRGLFTYIQTYVDSALEWHMLHNCKLIIDGSNLAHDIYSNTSGINGAYGGDYDKYASAVEDFLKKLIQCKVEPYIVMDGGHPLFKKKFKTVCDRMNQQISSCLRINPSNQSAMKMFPIMARSVFVNVAQKLGVNVLQCDFEADDEIVVLAKKLDAYVLSNDSDFYLFDVKFIILNSVNLRRIQREKSENDVTIKYIPCYRFSPEIFTEVTKVPKVLFPLLAPTLGNDFVFPSAMVKFYEHIADLRPKKSKISDRHQIIISVIKWLSIQSHDPEVVLNKVLEVLSDYLRDKTAQDIKYALESYYPSHSSLSCWVTSHSSRCQALKSKRSIYTPGSLSKIDFQAELFIPQIVKKGLECTCKSRLETQMTHGAQLPDWFIRAYRLHLVPPIIANILNKKYFFIVPQIELQARKSIYLIYEPIVRIVRGILWLTLSQSIEMQKLQLEKPLTNKSVKIGSSNIDSNFFKSLLERKNAKAKEKYSKEESASEEETDGEDEEEFSEDEKVISDSIANHLKNISIKSDDDSNIINDDNDETMDEVDNEEEGDCSDDKNDIASENDAEDDNIENNNDENADELESSVSEDGEQKEVDCNDEAGTNEDEKEEEEKADNTDENEVSLSKRKVNKKQFDNDKEEVNFPTFHRSKKIPCVKWYIRRDSGLCGRELPLEDVNSYKIYPNLFQMEQLSMREKRLTFYRIANLKIEFDEALPPNLDFILYCICFWHKKNGNNHIHHSCVLAVLMSTLMFCVIDGKFGRRRSLKTFENASADSKKVKAMINSEKFSDPAKMTISELIQSLTQEECQLANLDLYQFHFKNPADGKKNYNIFAVHAFSEYQAAVYFLQLLNSITCFPYPSINIESFWSGTFCYNMQKCFFSKLEMGIVLVSLLNNNTRIIHLFTRLYSTLQKHLDIPVYTDVVLNVPNDKKNIILSRKRKMLGIRSAPQLGIATKKRKKNKKSEAIPAAEFDMLDNPTTEELEALSGNRFSTLLLGAQL